MKSDINQLMKERDLKAILVTGSAMHNPAMVYLTGGGHITHADLIKPVDQEAVLFCSPMERDEAALTGLQIRNIQDYNWKDLLKQAGEDPNHAIALRYKKMLTDCDINQGKVAVFGRGEVGTHFAIFSKLQELMPQIEIIGESIRDSSLLTAMSTKGESEVERIRKMGAVTTSVVAQTAEYLTSHSVKNEVLVKNNGEPLTVGDVKRKINLWLAEKGVENPHGTIFAIGRDAGVPHSTGNPNDFIVLGKTIVFDIFPCEAGGGYHYDFTRTWCLGYAPDQVQALYEDVLEVYQTVMDELVVDVPFKDYQDRACQLFEFQGHPTIKTDRTTQEGYVHSLGHGVGLQVHEAPWSGVGSTERDRLLPGIVATIEPGLYYPSRGMGCRLEDTITISQDRKFEVLAEYPLDLVLPVK